MTLLMPRAEEEAPEILPPLLNGLAPCFHWYTRLEPAAVTVKAALAPNATDWLVGCAVMVGPLTTESVTPALSVAPSALLKWQEYVPASAPVIALIVRFEVVVPAKWPLSDRFPVPDLLH